MYDTDNNFLQALDTHELHTLLPRFLSSLPVSPRIVDLGCGTGRNTARLLSVHGARIVGLDASAKMLERAKERCRIQAEGQGGGCRGASSVDYEVFDLLDQGGDVPAGVIGVDAVISTLVLEHVPLEIFFACVAKMLRHGGRCLVTNMHADMGKMGGAAGFKLKDVEGKIRMVSLLHEVEDVVGVARQMGLELKGELAEVKVEENMVTNLGERSRKFVGGKVWFAGEFERVKERGNESG